MLYDQECSLIQEAPLVKMILVVEDDTSIGALLLQVIEQETPYQALLVTDGFQALKLINEIKPHLFLLDYQLPKMNGIDLYDRLHATKELEETPAIMISAYLPKHEIQKRSLIGMRKPFELGELLDTVEQLLA